MNTETELVDEVDFSNDAYDVIVELIDNALKDYGSRSLVSSVEIMNLLLDVRTIAVKNK